MTHFMKNAMIATALSGLLIAAPALAEEEKVQSVKVDLDLPAITNQAAAARYSHIADDLTNQIVLLLGPQVADKGAKIAIDISEVELSNSFTEAVGAADTKLVGDVKITDTTDNSIFKSFVLTVDVNQARGFLPTDIDYANLSASSDVYYNAMISAFAKNVVKALNT